jgi:uncharacterized repeat protein (TIGR03803 family)
MLLKRMLVGLFLLFNITYSGIPLSKPISLTLCLSINGSSPLSCQNYTATQSNLSITTTAANHTYQYAGIKINMPGYEYTPLHGEHLGYGYLGAVSDKQSVTGSLLTSSDYQSVLSLTAKGYNPQSDLLLVNDIFYGTTTIGGAYDAGTVFSINPDGSNYNTLYSFGANTTDGQRPTASLINVNGVLFGTTTNGGANGAGTLFSINPDGSHYSLLYANVNGVLYGTTFFGGANSNAGTLFSINPDGSNYHLFYSFGASGTDGTRPNASLLNVNGILYGTTTSGGTHSLGTVFSINADGSSYSRLYSFGASGNDGRSPRAALINVSGVLYSTTTNGGVHHAGTVFSIHPNGSSYTVTYSFGSTGTEGRSPQAALFNVNGILY